MTDDTPYAKLVREQLKGLVEAGRITIDNKGTVRITEAALADMLMIKREKDAKEETALDGS